MRLFIDTNIFLSFYHLTSEDIEELKKLVALIDQGEVELLLTDQVIDEFYRNRASKINDALKKLKEAKFSVIFPVFCKDYEEYTRLRDYLKEANKKHADLVRRATEDAQSKSLSADGIVEDLFSKASTLTCDDDIYLKAQRRVEVGNPPGKNKSLGDALNWECMLKNTHDSEPLHFVTGDSDYASPLFESSLNEFLAREWSKAVSAELIFYRKISDFFKSKYPSIKLASEVEKDILIQQLAASGSFSTTHEIIAQLLGYAEFNIPQVEKLISIPDYNYQVGWIVSDPDLQEFYKNLQRNYSARISGDSRKILNELILDDEDDDDIPF